MADNTIISGFIDVNFARFADIIHKDVEYLGIAPRDMHPDDINNMIMGVVAADLRLEDPNIPGDECIDSTYYITVDDQGVGFHARYDDDEKFSVVLKEFFEHYGAAITRLGIEEIFGEFDDVIEYHVKDGKLFGSLVEFVRIYEWKEL